MKKTLLVLMFVLLMSISAAYAVDLPPTATIIATPGTTVNTTVTITVQAIDIMDNAGLVRIELYRDNVLNYTQNCSSATTCTLPQTFAAIYPVNMSFYGIAYDLGSNTRTTNTINVTFNGVNTPPNLTGLPARTINEDSGLNANITNLWNYANDTWTLPQNLVYTILNQSNTTVANCVITANQWIDCTTPTLDAYGSSTILVQAFDGVLYDNDTFVITVAPVNDPPVFNATIPNIAFAEDTNYTFNISDYVMDVDNEKSQLTFTNFNTSNLTVQYFKTGNLTEVRLTSAANFTGILYINFTANDGQNSSNISNNVMINVTPVNDAPFFIGNPPVGAFKDLPFSYQFNASDIDVGDTLTFYDNTTLFDINLNTGLINFIPNSTITELILITVCDNSGAATNCTNRTWSFRIYEYPQIAFSNNVSNPASPATYTENSSYSFRINIQAQTNSSIPLTQNATIDTVLFEFNGANYTVTNSSGSLYNTSMTGLVPGNYTYRWHANYTNGLRYSTNWYNYTINKATPILNLTSPLGWNITYGPQANVTCNTTASQVQPLLTLYRNGTNLGSLVDTTWLNAGSYNYTCTSPETQNYTAASAMQILTVNPVQAVITLSVPSPITYNASANVTCSMAPSYLVVTPTLTRNGAALGGLTDTSLLAAGTYNYTCYYNTTSNVIGDSKTAVLTVNQAAPVLNLTLSGQSADLYVPANFTTWNPIIVGRLISPNVTNGYLEMYVNNTFFNSSSASLLTIWPVLAGSVPITLVYNATQNYSQGSVTYWVYFGTPVIKSNMTPASGSSFNGTSTTLSFTTNLNVSCNWSLSSTAVTTPFTTTGGTAHSTSITGLLLGPNNVYVMCTNETTATNLSYTVQNIFSGTTALTNGAAVNNSVLANTPVSNSTLQTVNSTNSVINGSILTNCTVINSTVKNYMGSNCRIVNSWVDPPNPGSDLTGSTITGNSIVYSSNVTYSYVDNSRIYNSNVNGSNITNNSFINQSTLSACILNDADMVRSTCGNSNATNSQINLVTMTGSSVTNSTVYNATLVNAIITNGVITGGVLIYNGTNYTNGSIASIMNLPPRASFTPTSSTANTGTVIQFFSRSTDPNNDSMTYFWTFGDGTNSTAVNPSVIYFTPGNYTVTLRVTDTLGLYDTTSSSGFIISAAPPGGGGTPPSGNTGGGGGGGGGYSPYGRTWYLNLDKRGLEIAILGRADTATIQLYNKTHTLKMTGIDRQNVNFTIDTVQYSLTNQGIKTINFDNDGYDDMRIIIMSNYYTRAQIRFDRWHSPVFGGAVPMFNFTEMQPEEEQPPVVVQPPVAEQPPATEQPPVTEQPPAEEQPPEEEITEGFFSRMISKIPANNTMIGIGITVAIVLLGLLIYWLFTTIFI